MKYNLVSSVKKHKARLVAKGHLQHYGVDYFEMFSPATMFETIRMLLSIVAQVQWKVGLGGPGHGLVFGTPFGPNLNSVSVSVHLSHGSVRS